jgi:3-mercaptopyruvate sulfurtransferase SseA
MGRGVFADKAVGLTSDRASSTAQAVRSSVQDPEAKAKKLVITFDELTAALAQAGQGGAAGLRLVDVREPKEIEETGRLPGAINIPLTKLKASLALEPAQFEAEFGALRPTKDDPAPLVFYGLCGVKSSAALEIAHKLGYKKARNYPGGWEEWSLKHPKV